MDPDFASLLYLLQKTAASPPKLRHDIGYDLSPLPLTFDGDFQVGDSFPVGDLSNLPPEILVAVVANLDAPSLASFAQVSKLCRQLARSNQFQHVTLTYDDSSWGIIDLLLREQEDRLADHSSTSTATLGSCIRRLTISTVRQNITTKHRVSVVRGNGMHFGDDFFALSGFERTSRCAEALSSYDLYSQGLSLLISDSRTLPNLDFVDWRDFTPPAPIFFENLSQSKVRHIRFTESRFEHLLNYIPAQSDGDWKIRSLNIKADLGFPVTNLAPYPIFEHCSPHLETLIWAAASPHVQPPPLSGGMRPFSKLRKLSLRGMKLVEPAILDMLLTDRLTTLAVQVGKYAVPGFAEHDYDGLDECLGARGTIPSLQTLILDAPVWGRGTLRFLKSNTHVVKLQLPALIEFDILRQTMLPLLASSFSNLESLLLTLMIKHHPKNVEEIIPRAIGNLVSLKQLCLDFADCRGFRNYQKSDNQIIRQLLSNLKHLNKLALTGEWYAPNARDTSALSIEQSLAGLPFQQQKEIRGQAHREQMLVEAEIYGSVFPHLEWACLGHYQIGITKDGEKPKVKLLRSEREDHQAQIQKIFGWWETY